MNVEFATLTSKGQIVLPASVRKKLRLKQGTRIAVHETGGQIILQPVTDAYIDSVCGMLGDTTDLIEELRRDHEQEDLRLETLRSGRKRIGDPTGRAARSQARRRTRQRSAT